MSEPAEGPSVPMAVAVWAPAFAVLGTALGTVLQLTGKVDSVAVVALRGSAIGALAGLVAGWIDQQRAMRRPAISDGRGHTRHHGSAWVMVAPLVLASLGFFALVVLATVQSASVPVGGGFLVAALLALAFCRPLWTRARLARAAEALALGQPDAARASWRSLLANPVCTRPGRMQAHLNLGLSEMLGGDLQAAEHHYSQVVDGGGMAFAQMGIGLLRTLKADYSGAEAAIGAASSGGRRAQAEVDGVRVLLVWRRDGVDAARDLAIRLHSPTSGSLFLGLYAAICRDSGDQDRADALVADGVESALAASGLNRVIRELDVYRDL